MRIDETFQDSLSAESVRERMLLTVRIVPLFHKFSPPEIDEVLKLCKRVKFDPMEVIFEQGSKDRKLHMILEGTVIFYVKAADGSQVIVGQRGHDAAFGEIAFITGAERNTSAKAGPTGGDHLVIDADDFQQLAARRPELLFKVLGTVVENINERLQDLPANFRNFIVWNTKGSGLGKEGLEMDWMPALAGLGVGAIAGSIVARRVAVWLPMTYEELRGIPYTATATMVFFGLLFAIVGGFIGWYFSLQRMKRLRGGVGPRCCMNCSYVVWEGVEGKFGCAYLALGLKGKIVKPGKDYDTPTDCPTFQYREIARLG